MDLFDEIIASQKVKASVVSSSTQKRTPPLEQFKKDLGENIEYLLGKNDDLKNPWFNDNILSIKCKNVALIDKKKIATDAKGAETILRDLRKRIKDGDAGWDKMWKDCLKRIEARDAKLASNKGKKKVAKK